MASWFVGKLSSKRHNSGGGYNSTGYSAFLQRVSPVIRFRKSYRNFFLQSHATSHAPQQSAPVLPVELSGKPQVSEKQKPRKPQTNTMNFIAISAAY